MSASDSEFINVLHSTPAKVTMDGNVEPRGWFPVGVGIEAPEEIIFLRNPCITLQVVQRAGFTEHPVLYLRRRLRRREFSDVPRLKSTSTRYKVYSQLFPPVRVLRTLFSSASSVYFVR